MVETDPIAHLRQTLADLVSWFEAARTDGVVVGGVAASILGRPRATRDVDAIIWLDEPDWPDFLATGETFGFVPRRSDCLEFARTARVLLVRHERSGIDADVILGLLPFEAEMIRRAQKREVAGVQVPLPTTEDLIIMKALARRARDVADIEGLLAANPNVDRRRIRERVREFAEALDSPDMVDDLERVLNPKRDRKP